MAETSPHRVVDSRLVARCFIRYCISIVPPTAESWDAHLACGGLRLCYLQQPSDQTEQAGGIARLCGFVLSSRLALMTARVFIVLAPHARCS